ncbi:MAG: hypothetical protein K2K17_07705 [Lachnospiraceae bacterium]|nr:hypothetical protein [Lachnospiraceae bacterium]
MAQNAIAFTNSFLEYLIVFGVSVVVVLIACFLGVSMKKSKNAKMEMEAVDVDQTGAAGQENTEES